MSSDVGQPAISVLLGEADVEEDVALRVAVKVGGNDDKDAV